jgi:hypothetical protein
VINNNRFKSLNLNCWVWLKNTKWKKQSWRDYYCEQPNRICRKKKEKLKRIRNLRNFGEASLSFLLWSQIITDALFLFCRTSRHKANCYYYYILRIVLLCTVHPWIQNLSFFKSFIILLPRGFIMSSLCQVTLTYISNVLFPFHEYEWINTVSQVFHLICNTVLCTVSFFNIFPNINSLYNLPPISFEGSFIWCVCDM